MDDMAKPRLKHQDCKSTAKYELSQLRTVDCSGCFARLPGSTLQVLRYGHGHYPSSCYTARAEPTGCPLEAASSRSILPNDFAVATGQCKLESLENVFDRHLVTI